MKLSIRSKLILAIGLPLLAVYLGVIWLDYVRTKDVSIAQTQANLRSQARAQSARVEAALVGISRVADHAADVLTAGDEMSREATWKLLERALERTPPILWAGIVLDGNGSGAGLAPYVRRPSAGVDGGLVEGELPEPTSRDWYRRAVEGGGGWGEPFISDNGRFVSIYSVPVIRDGQPIGAVAVDVDIDWLRRIWQEHRVEDEEVIVVSRQGMFLCHPDETCVMTESTTSMAETHNMPDWRHLGEAMVAGSEGVQTLDTPGERKWAVYSPIDATGWSYAAVVPESRVLAPVYEYLEVEIGILLIALGLVELIVLVVSVTMTRPIQNLARAVGDLGVGDLDAKVAGAESSDEIGEVARAFNKMVDHLNDHVQELSRQTAAREATLSELRVARTIQESMLPVNGENLPNMGSVSLHAVNHPAKEVAGDFYDYFETERPGVLGVLIADVSGKGVPAALFMAVAKTVIRNLARGGDLPPGEVLTRANQLLLENNDDQSLMFVTLFFFYYDTKTGTVTYANAGHNRPFVLSLDGRMRKVDGQSGPLLGALEDRVYAQGEETLQAGEALVMYTDGVTEAMAPEGVQFGEERLVKLLGELAGSDARRLSERIVREVDTFEDHRHGDDITVLAVQRRA
ncbi:MAG: SpoIIE family protein phosphatase [Planctomycetes bacterium]|jgi:sigma-B regulation protein RsbU (phosphoserine phosphatase)|nr:SpoIIE family protein phosphatase [Planctomycetota bacterium]